MLKAVLLMVAFWYIVYTVKLCYNIFLGPQKSVAQKLVRNNRGYFVSKYVLTDIFCMEKWRDREEVYAITEDML